MDLQDIPAKDAPLTVNEQPFSSCTLKFPAKDHQVIVMSGHETIRVLEVEVDSSTASSVSDEKVDSRAEGSDNQAPKQPDACSIQDTPTVPQIAGGTAPAVSISAALHQAQATLPINVQACPQLLTQESLTTLMTGMMAQAGSLGQSLLIPLSMAGSLGGQGGLALLTLPTTNVATLPGLAAATTAGNLLKLPYAGLQAATVLNPLQQVTSQPTQVTAGQVTAAQMASATTIAQPGISIAALQTAGLSFNPAIFSTASLGAQPQFLSSLTSTPIFTTAMSNMAGLTSQIITNAQGQVIGTLPLLLNPASLAGGAATHTLPLQGLQLQTVTPQLLFNAQGQIVATLGGGTTAAPTAAAMLPKVSAPSAMPRPSMQASVTTVAQSPVIIAPQACVKTSTAPIPISCADVATVGQLVSKPQHAVNNEEGINLEEIREFAKNFKIRRLSLGLTQTQVGQALTATEGPAYSQSAICRFEKLDITPKSAQKLKPVLERWLEEAELWNQKGQQNLMEFVGGEPSKKRKRRTSFTPQAIEVLNTYFEKNALPTGQEITEIARELNYDREVVRVWFCNRRQTLKNTSKINVFQIQ
ncbi:hypothetical protein NHX12_013483 [Muraenolepis orangiensis]|uniref:POU domain protein n=1 Tax=Muraenolepis orangiensis TaxID=630683 RepID=A0A9Q0DEQ0_9TELE|nr:hypothetical protein NHX12_013483 [Muraenolepis orangiensis]